MDGGRRLALSALGVRAGGDREGNIIVGIDQRVELRGIHLHLIVSRFAAGNALVDHRAVTEAHLNEFTECRTAIGVATGFNVDGYRGAKDRTRDDVRTEVRSLTVACLPAGGLHRWAGAHVAVVRHAVEVAIRLQTLREVAGVRLPVQVAVGEGAAPVAKRDGKGVAGVRIHVWTAGDTHWQRAAAVECECFVERGCRHRDGCAGAPLSSGKLHLRSRHCNAQKLAAATQVAVGHAADLHGGSGRGLAHHRHGKLPRLARRDKLTTDRPLAQYRQLVVVGHQIAVAIRCAVVHFTDVQSAVAVDVVE